MPLTTRAARRRTLARVERLAGSLDRLTASHAARLADSFAAHGASVRTALPAALRRTRDELAAALVAGLVRLARLPHADAARLLAKRIRRRGASVRTAEDLGPDDLARLVLKPPSAERLLALVGVAPQRLTRAAAPERVTAQILDGIAAGWDRHRIAREVRAAFDVLAGTARRIARTEGLRVATQTQLAVSEQIPDLVVGYKIRCVADARTRPDHLERDGTVYYREPGPGQLGFGEMPHPPLEADGSVAWNCRCWLMPIVAADA